MYPYFQLSPTMRVHTPLKILVFLVTLLVLLIQPNLSVFARANKTKTLETVKGRGCQDYGEHETPDIARRGAEIKAQENAIRTHGVFIRAYKRVNNLQLEEDIIETFNAGKLEEIRIGPEEHNGRTICLTITAKLSPESLDDLIQQQVKAMETVEEARKRRTPENPAFGLKVWTNKPSGRFVENERLIVYVQSERDTYLMLDYFQADGTVVHLVPNKRQGQVFIEKGKTYTFGDEASPEPLIVSGPYGAEALKAIATIKMANTTEEAEASVEIKTESLSVSEYRKKKTALTR